MLVRTDISVARPSMNRAWGRPTLPTTKPRRRKKMMPRIVSTLGVKTPPTNLAQHFLRRPGLNGQFCRAPLAYSPYVEPTSNS